MEAEIFNQSCWVFNCTSLNISKDIEDILLKSKFLILKSIEHEFIPNGFTKVWLLGESHLATHTFHEEKVIFVELSSCSEEKYNSFWTLIQQWSINTSCEIQKFGLNHYKAF